MEETLNGLLEAEAEKLTQAARYERSEARQGYRSGHYDRNLTTTTGDVTLHVPRLKGISFETAIIERYRRRESSVEEALIEMYLAGVSVQPVEDITEALWAVRCPHPPSANAIEYLELSGTVIAIAAGRVSIFRCDQSHILIILQATYVQMKNILFIYSVLLHFRIPCFSALTLQKQLRRSQQR